jgi:hypothetical protein
MNNIDLVYPCHSKDKEVLQLCIKYARKNIKNLNNIYVVSKTKLTDDAIWISEDSFPFSFQDMVNKIGNHNRTGWYYAGWIHLLSIIYIPNILDNVLICDSDTIFLKPIEFVDTNGNSLLSVSPSDGTPLYYEHMLKLVPGLTPQNNMSGVCHHILINKEIMNHMIKNVEKIHDKKFHDAWIDVTCENYKTHINENKLDYIGNGRHENGPGRATSYELYFSYAIKYFSNKVKIRPLDHILAYKGFINVKDKNFRQSEPSRTSKRGKCIIVPENVEKNTIFNSLIECLEFHINECKKQNFDAVTFQNHTREGSGKITGNSYGDKR